jgi:O-antigen ligase
VAVAGGAAMNFDRVWSLILAAWLLSVFVLGGTGFPTPPIQTYFTFSSLVLIAFGLWRLRKGLPSRLAAFILVLAVLSFVLVLAQLVPIPYDFWKSLPGRDVPVAAFEALGQMPDSLPMTLSADATRKAAVSLLPPFAAFLAVLSLERKQFWLVSGAIVAAAIAGSVIGMIQNGLGAASGLFFYHDPGAAKFATGTFANRNFFAVQLYASVPFLAALAMVLAQKWRLRPLFTSFFTLVYIGSLIAVLAAVGSRGGIIFAMVSVLATMLLVFRPAANNNSSRISIGKGIAFMLVGLVVMAQASMVGILRLAETDPINDLRGTIAAVSFQAAKAQFPWGSGFGTFVPVYQLYETPQTITDPYINHAHNEWLQLAIEGGAPAMFLMAIFVLWLAYALIKAFRLAAADPAHAHTRASGLATVLILLHSIVDFPLRTDAHLTFLGICVGLLALATASTRSRTSGPRSAPQSAPVERPKAGQPSPFRPANRGFSSRRGTSPPTTPDGQ